MKLSQLINRRGNVPTRLHLPESPTPFATATVATVATLHYCKTSTVATVASVASRFSVAEGEKRPTVATVATVAVANPSENATTPAIEPTHRTTVDLIFNNPETGIVRTIPTGTHCRRFSGATAAMLAGVKLDYMGEWAAHKNIERGYCLIWIDGLLRGVHFSDIAPMEGTQND